MPDALTEYFEALDRLRKGKPTNVPKGSKINNDIVALEAGRKRGSIKKSRLVNHDLIQEIKKAAEEQSQPKNEVQAKLVNARANTDKYRRLWEGALARELSLLYEVHELKQELIKLKTSKMNPIRS